MGSKLKGLDELRRKLEQLSRNAQNLEGPVAFDELFPPEFMRRYTDFPTIEAMIATSGFTLESRRISKRSRTLNGGLHRESHSDSRDGRTCNESSRGIRSEALNVENL